MKKKIIVAMLVLLAFAGSASAFDFMSAADGIKDSSIFVNIGVGIGGNPGGENVTLPPLSFSVDYLLPIPIPLSVGGFFSFAMYGNDYSSYKCEQIYMAFGGRVAWHVDLGLKNLDLYLGAALGYMMFTHQHTYPNYPSYNSKAETGSFYFGGFLGARYFFTNNIGVWLEAGYSALTYASLGLALKF